ncbi:MAG TPA: DUF1583 domain-containing protein, partial [Planctomycetaceae bacterium]|nr:DUF1583 domain-containing protein [Planctomycetaceae bacterium]
NAGLAGTWTEGLLRYQRPLVENGTIEYEFFYEPGKLETHPALDRLALLLHPSGIREHWITDGRHERAELSPDNVADVPQHRRGPAELPLQSGVWNRLKLMLRGQTVAVELNSEVVYERELEPTNLRTFGLFHYVDAGEVRVRNVVMRGDWPKSLPTVAEQELAGHATDVIDADLSRLKAVFTHDFQKDGLPDEYFKRPTPALGAPVMVSPQGVHVIRPAAGAWVATNLIPRFALHGDFDIEARFDQMHAISDKDADLRLIAMLSDERKQHCRIIRTRTAAGRHDVVSSLAILQPDGSRSYPSQPSPCEALSGRLRLARRGDKVYYLFAEGDSAAFRIVGVETVSPADVEREGVRLEVSCNGVGTSNVIWQKLVLRAERMTWFPEATPAPLVLQVMHPDGSGLRTIVTPDAAGLTHLGSPEWLADGRKVVLDMSTGSTTTSHVVVLNADGTGLQDLGLGCMPSFSADGKQIVFSQPGQGVMMMNADGTGRQVLEANAWGTQWSPDGKKIVYVQPGNITLLDVGTKKTRQLLTGDAARRYDMIYWNLGWSHDSRSIGFKARRPEGKGDELAVVDVDSPASFRVLMADAKSVTSDCTWSPDNQQLVVGIQNPSIQGPQLYAVSRKQPGPPQLLRGQPHDLKILGSDWSPDGQWIVIASQQIPQPVEWTTRPISDPSSP